MVELVVFVLEQRPQPGDVLLLARIGIAPGGDFVLLAEVADVDAEAQRDLGGLAAGARETGAGITLEFGEDRCYLGPVDRGKARARAASQIETRLRGPPARPPEATPLT